MGDDLTTMHAGAGPNIEYVIGSANSIFVMLDHDDGIAEVAQMNQRLEQSVIVTLMKPD